MARKKVAKTSHRRIDRERKKNPFHHQRTAAGARRASSAPKAETAKPTTVALSRQRLLELNRWDQIAATKGKTIFRRKKLRARPKLESDFGDEIDPITGGIEKVVGTNPPDNADSPTDTLPAVTGERLQKILSAMGYCSRRKAEELILLGAVSVNGQVVHELGTRADPEVDVITVEGTTLDPKPRDHEYYALNKPRGYVSTTSDPQNRPTIMDLMTGITSRIYPVGRLDYASEGLILFTNDGELAHKLMHPSSGVRRTYAVKLRSHITDAQIKRLRDGVHLADVFVRPLKVWRGEKMLHKEWVMLTLCEGKNLEIRRLFAVLGLEVDRLRRVAIGPLKVDQVPVGKYIPLKRKDVVAILEDAKNHE